MTKRIKQLIFRLSIASFLLVPVLAPSAHAQPNLEGTVCKGAGELQIATDGGTAADCADDNAEGSINSLITTAINIFSGIVGIVAVIMIVFGGFKYVTAGGDSSKITSAQHTIIYAIIGLIIVALAQIIVRFVLSQSVGA